MAGNPPGHGVSAHTRVTGIIGWPVGHSLSPAMHNAAFASCGLDWVYVAYPVDPDRVASAVTGLAAAGVAGLNVTVPHKEAVLEVASAVSPAVEAIGAANTLIPDGDGGWYAENTDAHGFITAVDEVVRLDLSGKVVVMIGAGGAAKAVAYALAERGATLRVANRTLERAAALGDPVPLTPDAIADAMRDAVMVVNCSSLGLGDETVPPELPVESLQAGQVVMDAVYRPSGTPWLRAAAERGAVCVDGLGMLLHQGARSFTHWTGVDAPVEVMRAALLVS